MSACGSYNFPKRLINRVTAQRGERLAKWPEKDWVTGSSWQRTDEEEIEFRPWLRAAATEQRKIVVAGVEVPLVRVPRVQPPSQDVMKDLFSGNLTENEYRFWIGSPYKLSLWSKCRACGVVVHGWLERWQHQELEQKCTTVLVRAYAGLGVVARCIVCSQDCHESRWGVVMHEQCTQVWRTTDKRYIRLLVACRQIVEADRAWVEKRKKSSC